MHSLTFYDYIILFAISLGLLLSVVVYHIPDRPVQANKVLVAILAIATIFLTGKIFTPRFVGGWVIRISVLVDTAIYIVGPLIFLYVKRMLADSKEIYRLKPTDYTLAVIHLIFFLWSLQFPINTFLQVIYRDYFYLFILIEGMGILSLSYYLSKSIHTLHTKSRETSHLKIKRFNMNKYLKGFLGVLSFLFIIWASSFIMLYVFHHPISFDMYNGIWVSIFIFFYMIGFFSLKDPSLLRKRMISVNQAAPEPNRIHFIENDLSKLMADKIYEDSDLNLQSLSQELAISPHSLSWFLNNIKQKSFNDFINSYRIDAFNKKIAKGDHLQKTLLGIALEVGFKSKSTFNKAFKDHLSMTPTQYVKQVTSTETRKNVA